MSLAALSSVRISPENERVVSGNSFKKWTGLKWVIFTLKLSGAMDLLSPSSGPQENTKIQLTLSHLYKYFIVFIIFASSVRYISISFLDLVWYGTESLFNSVAALSDIVSTCVSAVSVCLFLRRSGRVLAILRSTAKHLPPDKRHNLNRITVLFLFILLVLIVCRIVFETYAAFNNDLSPFMAMLMYGMAFTFRAKLCFVLLGLLRSLASLCLAWTIIVFYIICDTVGFMIDKLTADFFSGSNSVENGTFDRLQYEAAALYHSDLVRLVGKVESVFSLTGFSEVLLFLPILPFVAVPAI